MKILKEKIIFKKNENFEEKKFRLDFGFQSWNILFREIGVELSWSGTGIHETGQDKATGITRVKLSPKFFRPTEVDQLLGDASKAKNQLGWEPQVTFEQLVKEMVQSDIELMKSNPNA